MKFQWLNESEITEKDNRIEITAPAKSDFFRGSADERNGAAPMIAENAPFYYTENGNVCAGFCGIGWE